MHTKQASKMKKFVFFCVKNKTKHVFCLFAYIGRDVHIYIK